MTQTSTLQIDPHQMVLAIESTVDLVGMNDTNHGKRVGYIATQLAHHLGYEASEIHFLFELGLLHDCGVSSDQVHNNLVSHFDWEDAHIHCEIGYQLLKEFKPLTPFALPILHHHTPWETLQNTDLSPEDRRRANLIFLSDRIDVMSAAHYGKDILLFKEEVTRSIESYRDHYFDSELVDAFLEIQQSEAFWIALEERHVIRFTWEMGKVQQRQPLNLEQIRQMALIISYIVDQKSPFTAQHSTRVGVLARYLATHHGLSEEQVDKVEIAGFLHDIGKLRMPDAILDKPGALNEMERSVMNRHSYETYQILRYIDGIEDIALWAAYHHEGINRAGYPFHPTPDNLSIEARILSVADVFQALAQNRPYRKGMELPQIIEILDQYVESEKLDPSIVKIAKENQQKCLEIAAGCAPENRGKETPVFSVSGSLSI